MINNKYLVMTLALLLTACSDHTAAPPTHGEIGVAQAPISLSGNTSANAGPTTAVSGGPNLMGITIPTTTGVVGRIENGLEGKAKSTQGNFSKALKQVKTNLPKVTNINNAAGFDQIQLLVYAACSDLTVGGNPIMKSVYNVNPSATIATNQAFLVAAGVRMLDQHVAGLASQGPDSAQITTIFTNLVQAQAAVTSNTSTMAFMTVCIAANSAGTTLLGM